MGTWLLASGPDSGHWHLPWYLAVGMKPQCLCLVPDVAIEPRVLLPCLRRCATGYTEVTGLFCQSHSPYMVFGLDPGASRPLGVVLFRNPGLELIPG